MEVGLSSGVETLIKRMQTNPEEFFGDAKRWHFMFREHFRDVMTEAEKGAIHQAMREVRRIEFDVLVVKELLRDEQEQTMAEQPQKAYTQAGPFGATPPTTAATVSVPMKRLP